MNECERSLQEFDDVVAELAYFAFDPFRELFEVECSRLYTDGMALSETLNAQSGKLSRDQKARLTELDLRFARCVFGELM